MPSASETQSFQQSWQQTAAWAQSKGIKYNQYYPVYQLDSSRMLQYGASGAMSTAEREWAIQAAADPSQAFQSTPSTSANPWNIIHNTITDARNIFTGLGDIAIHPLHNGLVDSVKNTFDLIDGSHKLQGGSTADKIANLLSSTVLSWVPGAADLGTLMQADNSLNPVDLLFNPKGLEAEAEHPISSILDILPIANKLAALKVAASAGEAGGLAERAGMVVDEGSGGLLKSPNAFMGKTRGGEPIAERISVGRVAKGLLFNKELGKLGPEGELLKGEINPATNKLMTVGDTFHKMTGGSMFNANPDIADVSGEYAQINQYWTTQTEYLATPFKEATQDFDEGQKVELGKVLANSKKVGIDAAVEGVEDPRIIQAVEAMAPIEDWSNEMALSAEDGVREITNPRTGQVGTYSLRGHPEVFAARDAWLKSEQALAEPLAGIRTNGAVSLELDQMLQRTTNDLEQAKDAVRPSDYTGNIPATKILGRRRPTPTGKAGVLDSIVGPGGDVDRLLDRMREGELETVRSLSKYLVKRMDNWSPASIDASGTAPAELQALRTQVQKAGETADALITARSKAHDQIIGKATKWTSSSARDSLHREAVKSLDSTQKHDAADLVKRQDKQDADLHKSWTLKRKEIATRFAKGKADREHALADGISNINDRYDLAQKNARTDNLLARQAHQELQRGRQAQRPRTAEVPDAPFYHGTARRFENGRPIPGYGRSAENLYGGGFYTTDSKEIAGSYTGKGARGDTSKTVYGMQWGGDAAPNLIDLERPLPAQAAQFLNQYIGQLKQGLVNGEDFDETGTLRKIAQNAPGKEVLRQLRSDLRNVPDLYVSDADEIFDYISEELHSMGYDGLSHIGGLVAGGGRRLHQVRVFFDPNKLRVLHSTDVQPRDPSETPDLAPGAAGSPEAIDASVRTLEAHRTAEKAQLAESTAIAETQAVREEAAENASTDQGEAIMQGELKAAQAQDTAKMQADQQKARDNLATKEAGRASRDGPLAQKIETYLKDQKAFEDAIWAHPSDNFQPVLFDLFAKNLIDDERGKALHAAKTRSLMESGWGEDHLDQLHANKQVMATLVQLAAKATYDDPFFEGVDTSVVQDVWNSSLDMLENMAKPVEEGGIGLNPKWIHHVSATKADAARSLTVKVKFGHGTPAADVLRARDRELSSSKFDVMASLTEPMMQFARRAGFKDFVEHSLDRHVSTAADLRTTFETFYRDLIVGLDRNGTDYLTALDQTLERWNLVEFSPESKFGMRLPRWGDGKVYIDKDLLRAVEKMAGGKGALEGGIIEYGTKLFRFSILGLSPRYTAHITLGGTFLLALREPLFFTHIPELLTRVKDGTLPEHLHTSPSQMGTDQWEMLDKPAKLSIWNKKVGQDTAHYEMQEELAKQGIDWKKASPIQRLKALGNLNLRFTSWVNDMQKGLAYISGEHRGLAEGMTQDRATLEGMKAAEAVYGDLRRMSPFERDVARTIMPFYGWEKHILQYVMSYPADHPWRAMMLANIAEYDTAHSPNGLPSRYQFLFSLGSPDAQGNVTTIDLRSVNPLRDVANYATLQGFIGALNPAITSVAAEVDPDIIYGGNTLYPNLTYDQFYGIEEAGPQGNLLTSAEQFVPQLGAMQSALAVAGQRQGMSDSALLKNIGEQLNFPWVPQHINLRQEAAKTAIARYQVTKNLAATAWQSGNFKPIADLGSVPDPRNADYETPVSDLEQLYSQLAQQYPGQAPSDTATPLPSVHL